MESIISTIVLSILVATIVLFGVVTFALEHHWREYASTENVIRSLRKLYLSVSGLLFLVSLVSILIYYL